MAVGGSYIATYSLSWNKGEYIDFDVYVSSDESRLSTCRVVPPVLISEIRLDGPKLRTETVDDRHL